MAELKPPVCLIVYDYRHARSHGAWLLDHMLGMRYGARSQPYPYGYVVAYGWTARGALLKARRKLAEEAADRAKTLAAPGPVEVLRDCGDE